MSGESCPGTGCTPKRIVCTAAPGVRDLRNGRGVCPFCFRTMALSAKGKMRGHKVDPVFVRSSNG